MEDTIQEDSDVIAKHLAKQRNSDSKKRKLIESEDKKLIRLKKRIKELWKIVRKEDFDERTQKFIDSL